MLASDSNKGLLEDVADVGLHIPLGTDAVGTAWLEDRNKELTEGALGTIAPWREFWRSR